MIRAVKHLPEIAVGLILVAVAAALTLLTDAALWLALGVPAALAVVASLALVAHGRRTVAPPPQPPSRAGTTGIYLGPGVQGVVTRNNKFIGMDTGIEDHGTDSDHDGNEFR